MFSPRTARAAWRPWASASMCTVVSVRRGQRPVAAVVEADDREVARRAEPERAHGGEHAQRHVVVERGDRGDRAGKGEQGAEGVTPLPFWMMIRLPSLSRAP